MTPTTATVVGGPFAGERQREIARIVDEQGRARVTELAERFGVSAVTIRKDLEALADADRVIRTHGGAIAARMRRGDIAFDVRDRLQREEKAAIGALAAAHVSNGESIILDASTTGLYLARELLKREAWHGLTVVTNSIHAATALAGRPDITVLLMGGRVRSSLSVVGRLGDAVLDRVNVQKAFLSSAGFSLEEGLTEAREEEAQIKRAMVAAAREVYGIIDHSKWGRVASATFCEVEGLTRVFTDTAAPAAMVEALQQMGIEVTQHG
ncbi:MAG: DeoR/GlpR family DNA-binding transcription regulator [Candidatus Limnocylindrales bacterium]